MKEYPNWLGYQKPYSCLSVTPPRSITPCLQHLSFVWYPDLTLQWPTHICPCGGLNNPKKRKKNVKLWAHDAVWKRNCPCGRSAPPKQWLQAGLHCRQPCQIAVSCFIFGCLRSLPTPGSMQLFSLLWPLRLEMCSGQHQSHARLSCLSQRYWSLSGRLLVLCSTDR